MTTIAITGVAGLVGRRLVAVLERRPDVTRIVGIDRRTPEGFTSLRCVFRHADVRDPDLAAALHGIDVVIHLACQLDPIHDEAAMRAMNVDGTRNVVEAAERAGVDRLVHLSSVLAYGAAADNDVPLTEDSPLRGTPAFNYAEHKRDAELWLADWLREPRNLEVTVLRSAMVLGHGVDNVLTRLLEGPRLTTIRGYEPPMQFVHLDDLVAAIVHVIDHHLTGPYNVSAEGWLSYEEVLELVGRRPVAIPEEFAFTSTERLWELGIGEHPPGLVYHLMHPWVMSPAKLVATGWQPHITNRAALVETVAEHAGYVALLGVRARWSTVGAIAATVAAVTALLAGLGWRGWRRRRARRRGAREHVRGR